MNHFDKEHYSEQPAAKLLYTYPDVLPGTSTHKKPETLPTIAESYLTQWYRVSIGGREFALRPVDNSWEMDGLWPEALSAAESPAESDMLSGFVVGYWNADGVPSNGQARAEQSERATGLAIDITDEAIAVVTCERDNRWFEPALLLPGIERGQAQTLARELGQPMFVQITPWEVVVWDTASGSEVGRVPWRLYQFDQRPCLISRGVETLYPPKPVGGPWVARSMLVFGQWSFHYDLAHQLVPCDACGEVRVRPEVEQNRRVWDPAPASRFGPISSFRWTA